jgi:hypothetical protein
MAVYTHAGAYCGVPVRLVRTSEVCGPVRAPDDYKWRPKVDRGVVAR